MAWIAALPPPEPAPRRWCVIAIADTPPEIRYQLDDTRNTDTCWLAAEAWTHRGAVREVKRLSRRNPNLLYLVQRRDAPWPKPNP